MVLVAVVSLCSGADTVDGTLQRRCVRRDHPFLFSAGNDVIPGKRGREGGGHEWPPLLLGQDA